jgi:hypothetical protein
MDAKFKEINEIKNGLYKCNACGHFLEERDLIDSKCPGCGMVPEKRCSKDRICNCIYDIEGGTQVCTECGEFTCKCGSHSVMVLSRITGYIQEIGGWNYGKVSEFVDRHRVSIE